jgi:predicted metal-dependent phosphoesterase TrpH
MGLADLHIHTTYSWDGTGTVSGILKQAAYHTMLDVIAVTDHNEIQGALEARELASSYGIEVIVGEEVSTRDGHLLALFIDQHIPARMPLEETVHQVGLQGGLCIAPHPTSPGKSGIGYERLRIALEDQDLRRVLVAVEVYNGGPLSGRSNLSARKLPELLDIGEVANSDAHLVWTIGHVSTAFEGRTAQDMRKALETGQTEAIVEEPVPALQQAISWLRYRGLRSLGWVVSNPNPYTPLGLHRFYS